MERRDLRRDTELLLDLVLKFLYRFPGKRDHDDLLRIHALLFHQVFYLCGHCGRLSGACSRHHERGIGIVDHHFSLLRIKTDLRIDAL